MATEKRKIKDVRLNESLMVTGGHSMQVTKIAHYAGDKTVSGVLESNLGVVPFTLDEDAIVVVHL